jgi:hypothetical protein
MVFRICLIAFLSLYAGVSWGANPRRWNATMQPTSEVRIQFGNSENRLTAAFHRFLFRGPFGPLRLGLALSAPTNASVIQNSSQIDPGYHAFGYTGRFSIAWDTTYLSRYAVRIPLVIRKRICPHIKAKTAALSCRAQTIERWLDARPKRVQQWKQSLRNRAGFHRRWRQKQVMLQRRWHTLKALSSSLLTMSYTPSLNKRCRELIALAKRNHPKAFARQSFRRAPGGRVACLFAVQREQFAQQKAAVRHRMQGLQTLRRLQADAVLYKAIVAFRQSMLERQWDLSRRTPPIVPSTFSHNVFYAIGLDVFVGFRPFSAFGTLTATRLTDYLSQSFQIGPSFALYVSPRWSFQLQLGFAYELSTDVVRTKRCTNVRNSKAGVTNRQCTEVDVVRRPLEETKQLYARVGVTALFDLDCCSTSFGVELRAGLENANFERNADEALLELQLIVFSVSKVTAILGRFHLGIHMGIPLGEKAIEQRIGRGFFVLPFVGFGAGL